MRDRYIYILVPKGPKVKHLELCAPFGFARLSSGLHNDSPLTIRNNKMSLTERQRLSTKRYPLETPDFGARSSKGLKQKGNVLAPKDIHSKLLILVRDRYIYILVSDGLRYLG